MSGIMLNILGASFGTSSVGRLGLLSDVVSLPRLSIKNDELYASFNSSGFIVSKLNLDLSIVWQKALAISEVACIATDSNGNVIAGGNELVSTVRNGYIVKYDGSGAIQWQRQIDGNDTRLRGIALDSADNIYCVGFSNIASSLTDIYLAKFNSLGDIIYQKHLIPNFALRGIDKGIAITSPTTFSVVGTFGTNRAFSFIGNLDTAALTSTKRQFSSTTRAHRGVAVISGEAETVAYSLIDRHATSSTSSSSNQVLVRSVNNVFSWQVEFNAPTGPVKGAALCMDPSGTHVYTAAQAQNGLINNIFQLQICKYTSSTGELIWQRALSSGVGSIIPTSIAVDSFDNVYVFSFISGTTSGKGLVLKVPGDGSEAGSSVVLENITFNYLQTTNNSFTSNLIQDDTGVAVSAISPAILTPTGVPTDSTLTIATTPL